MAVCYWQDADNGGKFFLGYGKAFANIAFDAILGTSLALLSPIFASVGALKYVYFFVFAFCAT